MTARITVGILTFRRPEGLASTLPRVLEQVAQVIRRAYREFVEAARD